MAPLHASMPPLALLAATAASPWHACPNATSPTSCDASATCCSHPFSNTGVGCCPLGPDAVCCANGYTCCPSGHECRDSGSSWSVTTQCVDLAANHSSPGLQICKPGFAQPPPHAGRNCLVMGDSVSIGYTPHLNASLANDTCVVQHTPYSGDGGAEETAYGLQCLDYFLSSADGTAGLGDVDLLYFNWGLHNLVEDGHPTVPGQSGTQSDYLPYLRQIVERLLIARAANPRLKLLFGLTSPEMCDADADGIVQKLNAQAAQLMADSGIATVDLHGAIVGKCGAPPQKECLGEQGGGCPHYSSDGYDWIAREVLAPAFRAALG